MRLPVGGFEVLKRLETVLRKSVGGMGGWTPGQLAAVHRHIMVTADENEDIFRRRVVAIAVALMIADEELL